MNTKIIMIMSSLAFYTISYAQTAIKKTVPVSSGQKIFMHFDYPELIRVTTWDKNEISIEGTVSINSGLNDDAFELVTSTTGSSVNIRNEIRNLKSLPQQITVVDGSEKIVFKSKEELKKYQSEHGKSFNSVSYGVDMDILLEIKVPRNVQTTIESIYGMVEVKNFSGPLSVNATYGGVDVALIEGAVGKLTAETNYGEIYSNLDAKFDATARQEHFNTYVSAMPGKGPAYLFDSKFGNVYLRKAN